MRKAPEEKKTGKGRPFGIVTPLKRTAIMLPEEDIQRLRILGEKKGIGYQTCLKILLREALDREEARKF